MKVKAKAPPRPKPTGRPRQLDTDQMRLSVRLDDPYRAALLDYAHARRWDLSTAVRLILGEKLLGEKIPDLR